MISNADHMGLINVEFKNCFKALLFIFITADAVRQSATLVAGERRNRIQTGFGTSLHRRR